MIRSLNDKVNLVNSKQIIINPIINSTNKLHQHNKNDELKKAVKMALALRTKVDEKESEENKNCLCGGHYLKGIYNYKDIIVCDTCHRAKFFKSSYVKNIDISKRENSLKKNEEPKKVYYNQKKENLSNNYTNEKNKSV